MRIPVKADGDFFRNSHESVYSWLAGTQGYFEGR